MTVSSTLFSSHHVSRGRRLLEALPDRESPLTDEEVEAVVSHLDGDTTQVVRQSGSEKPYVSYDLNIGALRSGFNHAPADKNAMAEQFDQVIQAQAFAFIKSDVRIEMRLKKTQNWIRIAGVKRPFYHHQLYAAFWLVSQERGARRGAIEADLMGLGKVSVQMTILLCCQIC